MSQWSSIQGLFVQANKFSGPLNEVFNASVQQALVQVDVSENAFSGPIPVEPFKTANFSAFFATINCLYGTLPLEICSATKLTQLVLDGLTTAKQCQLPLFPTFKTIKSYSLTGKHIDGQIPRCLYSMPKLVNNALCIFFFVLA